MAKHLNLKLSGLWTAPNDYNAPEGALDVADNIVIDQKNLAQSRRGFEIAIDNSDGDLVGFPLKTLIATYPNETLYELLTYRYNSSSQEGRLLLNDEDTITGDNRFAPPSGANRVRMLNWGAYVYVTSNEGIKRYSSSLNSSVPAGVPQALDLILSLVDSSGFLTSNEEASVTATTTSASPTLSFISNADIAEFFIGQIITGTGIAAGTVVQDVILSAPVVIVSTSIASGSVTATVASATGVAIGQLVSGQGIQTNTRVSNVVGTTVTLSIAAIETNATASLTFSTDNTVTMSANASASGTVTLALSSGSQIAYRLVWGYQNENDATMLGAPSSFTTIVNNTGGTRNVQANASIPAGITTDNFYQLYRSVATPSQDIAPADQMQLVAEGVPSSGDITAGFITITDQTPDSLKGEALYTGSDIEGINQANYPPPTAADMAVFRGYTIYANYTLPYQQKLIIDGVGSPSGVQVGDEITISTDTDSFVLTADSAEDATAGEFQVFTAGTPAQNIADTAASFIRVLNRYGDNDICYAYLLSGPNDLPGQILLESRPGITAFGIIADSNGDAWTPNIDTEVTAVAENVANGILIAKPQEPEAVPRVNRFLAGGVGNEILRIIPLRDYTVVLTTDGVYRLTGQAISDFTMEPFDLTVQLIGPETAVALGNECWCLSSQGIVSISDGGVRIRSGLQINNVLQSLIQSAPNSLREFAFAVGYESNQRLIMALPDSEGDETCSQQFCYNYITDNWTRWTRNCTAGYVHPLDGLFLGNGANENIVQERKDGNFTDYVDESIFVLIQSFDGMEVVLDTVTGLNVGDLLWQDQAGVPVYAEILAIDNAAVSVTVALEIDWDIGGDPDDTRVLQAINCVVQWKPISVGDPTEAKQHSEGQVIFRKTRFLNATMDFATDISSGFSGVDLLGQTGSGWGQFPWGLAPWGGVARPKTLRFYVPTDKQYAGILITKLTIRSGYSDWELEGGSIALFDIGFELGGPGGDE
jgi:hypothetical protein